MMRAEVIGDPIGQSKSPVIHGFWLDALGIEAGYDRVHVTTDDLPSYIAHSRADPDWRGCNVTMPHKISILLLLDAIDSVASVVGAVNTVVRSDNKLIGYNTDVAGIAEPFLKDGRELGAYPDHVATYAQIIGTGGAARAAASALSGKFDLEFFGRDKSKAVELARECGLPEWFGMDLNAIGPIRDGDNHHDQQRYSHIIVNASPMGMGNKLPVPIDLTTYYSDTIVFDMVYTPLETPLLAAARRLGLRTIDGLEMLIGQAAVAFELFFGTEPPRDRDEELRALLTS